MNLGLNQFRFDAANAASKSLKLLEESSKFAQPTIGADRYNELLLESKLSNDARFFASLSSALEESDKDMYFKNLEVLLEATMDIYKEVDMKPRTCSRAVDTQVLTENVIAGIYSKNFTEAVNKDYAQPLFEGTLLQDYKNESKLLMESAVLAGVTEGLNSELFLKYALFENTLVKNCQKIIFPETLMERTENYIGLQDEEYFEVFTKNARTLNELITESIVSMVSAIAPKLFEESTGIDIKEVKIFAGISKALNK